VFFQISYARRAKQFVFLSSDPAAQDIEGIDPDESTMGRRKKAFVEGPVYGKR
jgi:hypothetical protein